MSLINLEEYTITQPIIVEEIPKRISREVTTDGTIYEYHWGNGTCPLKTIIRYPNGEEIAF